MTGFAKMNVVGLEGVVSTHDKDEFEMEENVNFSNNQEESRAPFIHKNGYDHDLTILLRFWVLKSRYLTNKGALGSLFNLTMSN